MAFDIYALNDSTKGLSICFIIIIFIVNVVLIIRTARTDKFLYKPRCMTVISLAVGDIFLALFSLVVTAKMAFLDVQDLTCDTLVTRDVYLSYLIHFVFGIGLVQLAVELVYRYRKKPKIEYTINQLVMSIFVSSLPWLLGLVVVLPLTMAGSYCGSGLTLERLRAMSGVCVILPAALAVIVCGIVMCSRLLSVQNTGQVVTYPGNGPNIVVATTQTNQSYMPQYGNPQYPNSYPAYSYPNSTQSAVPQYNAAYNGTPQAERAFNPNQFNGQNQNTHFTGSGTHYPSHGQHHPQQPPYQPAAVYPSPAPVYTPQATHNSETILPDPGREKNLLLTLAVVFAVCVVPRAFFNIGVNVENYRSDLAINLSVSSALLWLSVLRSFVTPLIWILKTRNQLLL